MTSSEAAVLIGCTVNQVQWLCRKGYLKAKRIMVKTGTSGTRREVWSIDKKSATKYRDSVSPKGGRPRGPSRSNQDDRTNGK